jgi:hydrogenase maturation protein HypF
VPRAIPVSPPFEAPVLACGALLKNTFCIGTGESAILGPHIGDLENLETYESYEASIARMLRFLHLTPEIVAYDLHPDYLSTRYALAMIEARTIGVQHHHAHVASAMAEHRLAGPVIGVAYDGTGYGTDGTAWGGEILIARYETFARVATFRPIALAGGDAAIRQPWRIALALLEDAFGGRAPLDVFPLFSARPLREVTAVQHMVASGLQAPMAHGVGRYFDGLGALGLGRAESRFEGQIALEWNNVADPAETGRYGFATDRTIDPWTLDLRPLVLDAAREIRGGVHASIVSARFHNTLAAATIALVRATAQVHGPMPVVLTGGCFQNARLAESVAAGLSRSFTVHLHRRVPPGDGGIALGQAVIASAIARN